MQVKLIKGAGMQVLCSSWILQGGKFRWGVVGCAVELRPKGGIPLLFFLFIGQLERGCVGGVNIWGLDTKQYEFRGPLLMEVLEMPSLRSPGPTGS